MSMSMSVDPVGIGRSDKSFAAAAQNAVDQWESQRGGPPEEPTTLKVLELYVTVHNPIGDYIAVLGTGG